MLKYGFRVLLQPPGAIQGLTVKYASRTLDGEAVVCSGCCPPTVSRIFPLELSPALCPHCHLIWDDGEHHLTRYERVWSQKGTPSLRMNSTCTDCNGVSSSYVGPIHPNQLPDRSRDIGIKPVQV